MKKLYFLFVFMLVAGFAQAQLVEVTFAVDMNEVDGFDPAEGVFVAGSFQSWAPMDGALTDDDGNGVWSRTYLFGPGETVQYKFGRGNDWGNNEGAGLTDVCGMDDGSGNFNRLFTVPNDGTTEVDVIFEYDSCEESDLAVNVNNVSTLSEVVVFPNPMIGSASISFQNDGGAAHDVTLTNLAGQVVREYRGIRGNNLNVERGNLAAGLYLVTFRNDLGETGSLRLMVQ